MHGVRFAGIQVDEVAGFEAQCPAAQLHGQAAFQAEQPDLARCRLCLQTAAFRRLQRAQDPMRTSFLAELDRATLAQLAPQARAREILSLVRGPKHG